MAIPIPLLLSQPVPRVLRPRRADPADVVRPTRAEINLDNLRHNLRVVRKYAGHARVYGVLKADGYGHGAPAVARTLERAGIDGICVALLEEGIELREAGIQVPVVIMGGYYGNAWSEVIGRHLTPVIYEASQIECLAREVRYQDLPPLPVHLKIDTGMSRLGARHDALHPVLDALSRYPEVRLEGMMTHFANADAEDLEPTKIQCELFDGAVATAQARGLHPQFLHAANSAAIMRLPQARYDIVRPGIALFGVPPIPQLTDELRPVMRVRSEVIALRQVPAGQAAGYGSNWVATKPTRIATIPIGYADGLSRTLSNQGRVLVRGGSAPIVGAVSMDLITVDVTEIPGVCIRDEVMIVGHQEGSAGSNTITVSELAARSSTIPWEVLTGISRRVPRFYREP